MTTAGLLLCGGEGSRFQASIHKLLHPIGHGLVVTYALDALFNASFDFTLVVDGAVTLGDYIKPGVILVHNPNWKAGMATSLQAGISRAEELGVDRVVVGLGDQPGILTQCWQAVGSSRERPIAVAAYHGERRNPVRLDSSIWGLLPKSGDEGARALLRAYPELVEEVDCFGDPRDIDTVEDLIKWNS